jgi:hypothetical protein
LPLINILFGVCGHAHVEKKSAMALENYLQQILHLLCPFNPGGAQGKVSVFLQ